jgi:hypothetical protein
MGKVHIQTAIQVASRTLNKPVTDLTAKEVRAQLVDKGVTDEDIDAVRGEMVKRAAEQSEVGRKALGGLGEKPLEFARSDESLQKAADLRKSVKEKQLKKGADADSGDWRREVMARRHGAPASSAAADATPEPVVAKGGPPASRPKEPVVVTGAPEPPAAVVATPVRNVSAAPELSGPPLVGAVDVRAYTEAALANIKYPDPKRALMYKENVEEAVKAVAPHMARVDGSPNKDLLARLGTDLATRMDEYVAQGIHQDLQAPGRAGVSAETYTNQVTKKDNGSAFLADHLPIADQVNVETNNFVRTTTSVCQRVEADQKDLGRTFLGGEAAVKGLSNIRVTDSDPHHGGERVMILEFNNNPEHKVVYKPRDVAIDARLVGHVDGQQSVLEKTNELLKARNPAHVDLPTHKFLPKEDGDRRYGYVEFLKTGRPEDHRLTGPETKQFYRQMGQLTAVNYFAGVKDLHQGNLMVSGKKPYFTDVEIAFNDGAHGFKGTSRDGGLASMEMTGSILKRTELEQADIAVVGKTGAITAGDTVPVEKATSNFIYDTSTGKFGFEGAAHAHADDIKEGFLDVARAYAANPEDVKNAYEKFRNTQVRVHPTETVLQLTRRYNLKNYPSNDAYKALDKSLRNGEGQDPARSMLVDSMFDDLVRRDVPYYTRTLGSPDLLHNGSKVVQPHRFADDGLTKAKSQIDALAGPGGLDRATALATYLETTIRGAVPNSPLEKHRQMAGVR